MKQDPCVHAIWIHQDGSQQPLPASSSMTDVLQQESCGGVYTVGHTYHRSKVLQWEQHLQRLHESAAGLGFQIHLTPHLRKLLRVLITSTSWPNTRFRLFVPHTKPSSVLASIEPFYPIDTAQWNKGVRCVTVPGISRDNPSLKHTSWSEKKKHIQTTLPKDIHTALLLSPNQDILEGLDSNFFAVLGGKLRSADQGILQGLSLQVIWHIAPAILPLQLQPVSLHDLCSLEEAFLTSSSRGVLPVCHIDDNVIGSGTPGPYTRHLRDAFDRWVEQHVEEL